MHRHLHSQINAISYALDLVIEIKGGVSHAIQKLQVKLVVDSCFLNSYYRIMDEDKKQSQVNRVALVVNMVGIFLSVWAIVYPKPYSWLMLGLMTFPLFVAIILMRYRGFIVLREKNKNAATVIYGLLTVELMTLIRTALDFEWTPYLSVVMPGFIIAIVTIFILVGVTRNFSLFNKSGLPTFVALVFFSTLYGIGVYIATNCTWDDSESEKFRTTITNKKFTDGTRKHITYFINVAPVSPDSIDQCRVSEDEFDNVYKVSDSVIVNIKPGRWGTRWYYLSK
jgi:hypothetical protein